MKTLHNLNLPTEPFSIATVTKAQGGQALAVSMDHDTADVAVIGHGSQVPVLHKGDQVLVAQVAGGYFIIDRARAEGEAPYMATHDGQLIFESQKFIGLKVKNCYIRMEANGELIIHADNLRAVAELVNEIQGDLVKLN